jgi:hypothetical protein
VRKGLTAKFSHKLLNRQSSHLESLLGFFNFTSHLFLLDFGWVHYPHQVEGPVESFKSVISGFMESVQTRVHGSNELFKPYSITLRGSNATALQRLFQKCLNKHIQGVP